MIYKYKNNYFKKEFHKLSLTYKYNNINAFINEISYLFILN